MMDNLVAMIGIPPKPTKDTAASEMSQPTALENEKPVSGKPRSDEEGEGIDNQGSVEVGFSVPCDQDASNVQHKNLREGLS